MTFHHARVFVLDLQTVLDESQAAMPATGFAGILR